jgi:hypothetical protein
MSQADFLETLRCMGIIGAGLVLWAAWVIINKFND